MTKVFMIAGEKGSGKDYVAERLKTYLENSGLSVELYAFADPIKEILQTSFGIDREQLDKLKDDKTDIILPTDPPITTNMRNIIQLFGTDAMQEVFGKTVWKQRGIDFVDESKSDVVIITDFRFPIEFINPSTTINIVNDDVVDANNSDNHSSENSMNDYDFDYILNNTNKPSDQVLFGYFNKFGLFNKALL